MSEDRLVPLAPTADRGEDPRGRARFGGAKTVDSLPAPAPRGVGEILDLAFELIRSHFLSCVGVAFVLWLPMRTFTAVLGPSDGSFIFGGQDQFARFAELCGQLIIQLMVIAFATRKVQADLSGNTCSVGDAILHVLQKLHLLAVVSIVIGVFGGVGLLMCCVPGFIIMWKTQLVVPAIMLEDTGIMDSFRRSWNLTTDSFLRWLGLYALLFVIQFPLSGLTAAPYEPTTRQAIDEALGLSNVALECIVVPLSALYLALPTALIGIAYTVFYIDQRVRREGHDLEMRLEIVKAQAAGGTEARS